MKTKFKAKFKVILTLLVVAVVLVGCGKSKNTPASELATKIVDLDVKALLMNTPDNFDNGPMENDSFLTAYQTSSEKWQEMLDENEIPEQYKPQVEGQQKVAQMLADGFENEEITSVAFVGDNLDGEISGLFIYYFNEDIIITDDRIEKANAITDATKSGEYFYTNGRYFIAVEQNFVKDKLELFNLLDEAIDGPNEETKEV